MNNFNKYAAGLAAALLGTSLLTLPAHAQDAAYSWTGFHFGAGGGYGSVTRSAGVELYDYTPGGLIQIGGPTGFDIFSLGNSLDFGGQGAIGHVEGGFDYQVGSYMVFGLLADYTFSGINSNYSVFGDVCYEGPVPPDDCDTATISDRPELALDILTGNSWSVGGRAGLLMSPRTLVYGLAAYTHTTVRATATLTSLPTGEDPFPLETRVIEGYTIGAGIETLLSEHVSAKLEYRGTFWSADESLGDDVMGFLAYSNAYVQTIRGTLSVRLGNWSGATLPDGSFGGQPYNWTGVHFGAGGGYGTNSQTVGIEAHDYNPGGLIQIGGPTGFDIFSLGNSLDLGGRGMIGTVEGGTDVQIGNHVVIGFMGDYTWSHINANYSAFGDVCYEITGDCDVLPDPAISDRPVLALDVTTGNNWSVGGRSGISIGSRTLIYGLGAYTRTTMTVVASLESIPTGPDPVILGGGTFQRAGYTFGTGVETMLAPHLSAKLEYRGTMWTGEDQTGDEIQGFSAFANNFVQTIRGTLSLRFGVGP